MRLIDGDKLYKRIKTEANPYGKPTIDVQEGLKVMGIIEQMPTVEAEPVRHGRWIKQTFQSIIGTDVNTIKTYVGIVCSECGKAGVTINPSTGKTAYKYCPYCGAKMDGKENGC